MKIAFLAVSLSLMVAISAYDWRKRQRDIFAEFQELAAEEVKCLLVQAAVLRNEVLDRKTLRHINISPNYWCIVEVSKAVADNDTVIKTVSDEAIIGMLKEFKELIKTTRNRNG